MTRPPAAGRSSRGRTAPPGWETTAHPGPAGSVSEVAVGDLLARPLSHDPMPGLLDDYLAVPGSGYDRPVLLAHGVHDVMVPLRCRPPMRRR